MVWARTKVFNRSRTVELTKDMRFTAAPASAFPMEYAAAKEAAFSNA